MAAGNQSEGERRQVAVLFADLVGFTAFSERCGEEAAYALMQHITRLLRDAVEEHDGTIKSFTGDGAMALFGVPRALEDVPIRACRAAISIHERVAAHAAEIEATHGISPQLRIGISTGVAVIGRVPSSEDPSLTALGDTVNLAERLQGLAEPGTVMLSESTQRLVQGLADTQFIGLHRIKGKAEPQNVYRLNALRQGAARFEAALTRGLTSYIGRDRELETLESCLNDAKAALSIIDVSGEAGMGKSRLVHEFLQRIGKVKAFILSGNCSPDGQQTPFLPFIDVVRGAFRAPIGTDSKVVIRNLDEGLRALGLTSVQNLALLLNLLGLKVPEYPLLGLDGTLIGLRTRDLLQQLFHARCRLSPVLLVIEDLHWTDRASEELLESIIQTGERLSLMVLHTRRPEYRPPWTDSSKTRLLPLEPLSAGETSRIVQARLGTGTLPQPLARFVAEKAEGNPLFAEEIASFLIERGVVRRTATGFECDTALTSIMLPASVQFLLSARVDALAAAERTMLQAAAVIGRRFDSDLLAAAVGGRVDQACLRAMQALDLIYRDKTGTYIFKHALVRDALYASLLTGPRAEFHLRVAEEIERRSGNRLIEVAEVLAHHYSCTSRADKAFRFLSIAGKKSLDLYSLEEAEQFFRRALNLLETSRECATDEAMADVVANLLQAIFLRSDMHETKRVAEAYLPRLESMGDSPQLAFALYFHAEALANSCDFRGCETTSRRALAIAQRVGDVKAAAYARICVMLASTVLAQYPLDAMQKMGTELLDDSKRANDNYALNWAYFQIAWDYAYRGLMNEARDWAWKLISDGRNRDDRRALGMGYWTLGIVDLFDGRADEVDRNGDECTRTAVTPFDRAVGAALKACAAILRGNIAEGLTQILDARRRALDCGWVYLATGMAGAAGAGLVFSGYMSEGLHLLENEIMACELNGDLTMAVLNRITLAEIFLGILSSKQAPPVAIVLKNFLTIVSAKLFGARRVRTLLEEASRHPQLHEHGSIRARINMNMGLLYQLKKQPALARQFLERARAPAELQNCSFMVTKIDATLSELC